MRDCGSEFVIISRPTYRRSERRHWRARRACVNHEIINGDERGSTVMFDLMSTLIGLTLIQILLPSGVLALGSVQFKIITKRLNLIALTGGDNSKCQFPIKVIGNKNARGQYY